MDEATAIAVDASGAACVTGYTYSTDFPYTEGLTFSMARSNAFVAKLRPDGTSLAYSIWFGGSGDDVSYGIALDSSGYAYLAGTTDSAGFPSTGHGLHTNGSVFVVKLRLISDHVPL